MEDFKMRICEIMSDHNCNQTDICNKTGIPKSSMSSWMSGVRKPKADAIVKIAETYNVAEAWVMGYDVPKERTTSRQKAEMELEKIDQEIIQTMISVLPKFSEEEKTILLKTFKYYLRERKINY